MKYQMDGGTVVDTDKASQHWEEAMFFDGRNMCSRATGSQWDHEEIYRSRKGRYYLVSSSAYRQGRATAEWVSNDEAARWLLANDHEETMPVELAAIIEEVSE